MRLFCTQCGARVSGRNIDLAHERGYCRECRAEFSLAALRGAANRRAAQVADPPPGLSVDASADELWIERQWLDGRTPRFLLGAFAAVLLAVCLYRFGCAGMLLPGVLALMLMYCWLAGVTNRTTVGITNGELLIRHEPLPWPGARNRRIPADEITRVFVQSEFSPEDSSTEAAPTGKFELWILLRDGDRQKMLGGLREAEQAAFFEAALEQRLGIRDAPVAGECRSEPPAVADPR